MNVIIGYVTLGATIAVALATLLVSLAAVRLASASMRRAAQLGTYAMAGLLTIASAMLLQACVDSDFALSYVIRYTERALPIGYKIAAFWAGQEGSLLLWAWLLAAMAVGYVLLHRKADPKVSMGVLATMALVIGFFAALMFFAANPFATVNPVPPDGNGLNPLLQDPAMISHPPVLFIGYAGFTIPFAMMIGALLAKQAGDAWAIAARPWVIVSWLFLGAGILLGAQWAYVELGWGGYWAWDPVENASLLPWLAGTALMHSIIVQSQRGMFRGWSAILAAITFLLCIFGTYLTRSGVVDSVHSFGASLVGTFFFLFLVLLVIATAAVMIWQRGLLVGERRMEALVSREGALLLTNILLLVMTAVTLLGTIFPIISRAFAEQSLTVKPSFYNKVVAPMGVALAALMALAPALTYGRAPIGRLARSLAVPVGAGVLSFALLAIVRIHNVWAGSFSIWALFVGGITGAVLAGIAWELIRAILQRRGETGESLGVAALRLLDANHRRYGGQLVHIGMAIVIVGIAASSLFHSEATIQLEPGQSTKVSRYTLKLDELRRADGVNYQAVEAKLLLSEPSGRVYTLRPQRRLYHKSEQPNTEVAILSTWRQDLYFNLATWDDHTLLSTIQVLRNPLVQWMWAGGIVMALGSIYCILPRALRRREAVVPIDAEAAPAPARQGRNRKAAARQVA